MTAAVRALKATLENEKDLEAAMRAFFDFSTCNKRNAGCARKCPESDEPTS